MEADTPLRHIRKKVLKVTQKRMAEIAAVSQATVSRWEDGELSPGLTEMTLIREEAFRLQCEWDDKLFFAVPEPTPVDAGVAA
jgi:predicted transcriptional regulator